MSETKTVIKWLQEIPDPIARFAISEHSKHTNESCVLEFNISNAIQRVAFGKPVPKQFFYFCRKLADNYTFNKGENPPKYPSDLLPDGDTLPTDAHEWRYNPENGFVYAALKEVEAEPAPKYKEGDKVLVFTLTNGWEEATYIHKSNHADYDHYVKLSQTHYGRFKDIDVRDAAGNSHVEPTADTPVPQPKHEYTPGEIVEVLISDDWVTGCYMSYNENTNRHTVDVLGVVENGFKWEELRRVKLYPTVVPTEPQPIPATEQPSDAMSRERFVQEAAMLIYCKHSVAADEAVLDAILLYNEIKKQLSK